MKPSRVFLLSFVAGMAAALAPSCQMSAPVCNATVCGGCCGSDGKCKGGKSTSACGKGGGVCFTCSAAETCQNGACVVSDGGPAGSSCSPSNCNGCCAQNGTCLSPSDTILACGQSGGPCQVCTPGQSCVAGACVSVCGGCIDSSNNCQPGTSTAACGVNGAACSACVTGQSCINGLCSNQNTCSSGCTDSSGTCQPGNTDALCGIGGVTCASCTGGAHCNGSGQCITPACAGCTSGGQCLTGNSNSACGLGGVPCNSCAAGSTCQSGTCQSSGCSMTGDPCVQHPTTPLCATNSTCVAAICSHDPTCCTTGWNSVCAGFDVNTYCPGQCGGGFDGGVDLTCTTPDTTQTCGTCGTERWSVKVTTDPGATSISKTVQTSTVQSLVTASNGPSCTTGSTWSDPRGGNSGTWNQEFTIYYVKNAVLDHIKAEPDGDYHMVIHDPSTGKTMLAEVPCPMCAGSGQYYCRITHARKQMETQFGTISPNGTNVSLTISIVGIGYFDPPHGQTGEAQNCLELHPVLGVCFSQDCNPTGT